MALNLSPFSLVKTIGKMLGGAGSEEDEAVQRVDAFYKAMLPVHQVHERQWYLNIANLAGNQWTTWDAAARRFVLPPAPTWRVRLVVNKILAIARVQMARLAERRKTFYVAPERSGDEALVAAAKMGTKYISAIAEGEDFSALDDEIDSWLVSCGVAHMFVGYDSDEGLELEEQVKDEAGAPAINPVNGKPVMRKFHTGDLVFSVDTPFEVIPDYSTIKWEEMKAICRVKIRSVEYIKEKYGIEVAPDSLSMDYSAMIKTMEQATTLGGRMDLQQLLAHAVMLKDYYEAPSKDFSKGRHLIVAGGKKLFEGVLKTKYKGRYVIPVITYSAIRISGRLMPMAPVEPLLPLQWEYNKTRSSMIEDHNLQGRPKLVTPIDSLASAANTDQPGEHLEFDPAAGIPPFYLAPPPPSISKLKSLERLDSEMMEIGGVHDISMGRLPRRATSGFALSILDEKDNTVMAPMIASKERGHRKVFAIALGIAQDEFMETRRLKIAGPGKEFDQLAFRGADIKGQHDVRVQPDDPFPTSRSAKLEFATQLAQAGIVSPRTVRRMLNMAEFAELDDTLMDEEDQRLQAMAMVPKAPEARAAPPGGAPPAIDLEELAAAMAAQQEGQLPA